jgi:hypothetical protein
MKSKNYILSYLFFIIQLLQAQEVILFDFEDKTPIPFANVSFFKNDELIGGKVCDMNGLVTIETSDKYDAIEFSCIGYETFIVKDVFNLPNSIYLKHKINILNEIIVSKQKRSFLVIGYSNLDTKNTVGIGKGIEEVVFIENIYRKPLHIKSFLFKIKKIQNKTAFRLHFYKKLLRTNEPGEELLTEDLIQYLDEKTKGLIEIDVANLGIELPLDGAYVGIEVLGTIEKDTGKFIENIDNHKYLKIEYNYELDNSITFIRNRFKSKDWTNSERLKSILPNIKSNKFPNASFGIKTFEE